MKGELRRPVPQPSEAENQALWGAESRKKIHVLLEYYLIFLIFISLTKFSK